MNNPSLYQDTWKLPESSLANIPDIHQKACSNVIEIIHSRTMQLIAVQTLRKINPQKSSLYKKMLERNLSKEEAISLIKIVGRFLKWETDVHYQFPQNEEAIVDYGLKFLHALGDTDCIIPCLEIFLHILKQCDQSDIFTDTLSKYGVYPIYQGEKTTLIYTSESGEQFAYFGNGILKSVVDYGEHHNTIQTDDYIIRRDTGEKIGSIKTSEYEYHIMNTPDGRQYLVYWDIRIQKGIVYVYNKETSNFERLRDTRGKTYFVTGWSYAGFIFSGIDDTVRYQ